MLQEQILYKISHNNFRARRQLDNSNYILDISYEVRIFTFVPRFLQHNTGRVDFYNFHLQKRRFCIVEKKI